MRSPLCPLSRLCAFALSLALLLSSAGARAESPSSEGKTPENPEAAGQAREHFRTGLKHFRERNYREAIQQFQVAAQYTPSADLWYNIARAYEELNELDRAVENYERYLRDRVDPPDKTQVEKRIASLKERLDAERAMKRRNPSKGTLSIQVNRYPADVQVDAKRYGEKTGQLSLALEPGTHSLEVRKPGYIPFRARVRIEAGVVTVAYVDLVSETRYEARRGRPRWTWLGAGLSAAALGTSIAFGVKAAKSEGDEEKDWAKRSDYLLGTAIALGVVTGIVYLMERRAVGTRRIEAKPAGERAALPAFRELDQRGRAMISKRERIW